MNKLFSAAFLFIVTASLTGCVFGKKTTRTSHRSVNSSKKTDKSTSADTTRVAPRQKLVSINGVPVKSNDTAKVAPKSDSLYTLKQDSAKLKVDTGVAIANDNKAKLVRDTLLANATALWHKPFAFLTFDGKAKMHYEGNGSGQDFTANFRVKKDSVIWVSISALGGMISVARAYITPDSIKVVNYLNKEVMLMPIDKANQLLPAPVDFSILQNLIVGRPLLGTGSVTDAGDSSLALLMSIASNQYTQKLTYSKADSNLQAQVLTTAATDGPKVSIQHTDYIRQEEKPFSKQRQVHVDNKGNTYELDMDFTSQSFNKLLEYPFSYSKNYKVNPQ